MAVTDIGGVLIAVKKTFDCEAVATRSGDRFEYVCVRLQCLNLSLYVSAVYLASDIGRSAFDLFVEDIETLVDSGQLMDKFLVLADFILPNNA
jgi:hypothetical protein